jgi:hypothetical protein
VTNLQDKHRRDDVIFFVQLMIAKAKYSLQHHQLLSHQQQEKIQKIKKELEEWMEESSEMKEVCMQKQKQKKKKDNNVKIQKQMNDSVERTTEEIVNMCENSINDNIMKRSTNEKERSKC